MNKHMQVEGFDNIYAIGDCADVSEPKMAYHAGLHAGVAAKNIISSLSGKPLTSYNTGNHISHCSFCTSILPLTWLCAMQTQACIWPSPKYTQFSVVADIFQHRLYTCAR